MIGTKEHKEAFMVNVNNYKTIKEVANIYTPLFTESSLRQMLHKNTDDIKSCVFKVGGKVLVDISKFDQWFKSLAEGSND